MTSTVVTHAGTAPADVRRSVRMAGLACLAAGVLGAASGLYMMFVPEQVSDDRYSYPLRAGPFVALQVWFFAQHLGLLAGQAGLERSGAGRTWRHARWGHRLGVAGMAALAITELLAIAARNTDYRTGLTNTLDVLYGSSSIAIGVGLAVAGTGVLRDRDWKGWGRWLPLVLGAWVFVPMTPAIAVGYLPARLAITGWMVLYALLGWLLLQRASRR